MLEGIEGSTGFEVCLFRMDLAGLPSTDPPPPPLFLLARVSDMFLKPFSSCSWLTDASGLMSLC